ncbi:LPD25 domain-containing protein [[Clostridium] symbiosum]|uniref:LPD25 domain-containing protein n=1 Tax=Clostridium symbiosum TaxID=1512 RepID=UPI0034A13D4C
MASLRDIVSEYQDDLRNGIAWLAFWREGRSWQAEAFHLDLDDTLYPEDRARLAEIQAADPQAVVVNGYYSGYLGEEMNVAELVAGVRHHYDNGLNNIASFMEAHSDELPPDVLEAAREKAHAAGLPFYERPYRGDDIDPYTYDGHMSIEDYELMQKLMEQDREQAHPKEAAPLEISNGLMLIDTNRTTFDMQAIQNRRFMFSPQTGELILGRQYRGNTLVKSHAEEHGESGAKAPFDSFLRGWVGTGKDYKDGVIHFAPAIDARNPEQFDHAFSTVEMFARNGANGKTVIRGFGDVWEQPLSELIPERRNPVNEMFSILLHNRQRYEQGKEGLWLSLPTTTEKLQEALREIGISADNPQDFFLYDYRSPQEHPVKLPRDLVLSAGVDELNFLAARLEKLEAAELAELNAALTSPQSDFHSIGQIIDYPDNVDFYVHLPDVTGTGQLGDYYLNRSGMVDMPEEWKAGIFLPRFGLHIANAEHGVFTDYGYLVKSGDEWQRVHEGQPVPEEYRVMAYPQPEADREAFRTEPAAPAAVLPEAGPIIIKSMTKDEYMKEITDRLEAGVRGVLDSENYKAYLTSMSKFHTYSFRNTMLIFLQKPDASLVAGLGKWQSEFERTRKQGEAGLKIIAPKFYTVKKRVAKKDPDTGEPIKDKNGKPVMEEQEITVPDYRVVSVYDVSQTEGKELPKTHVDMLSGDVEQFQDLQAALERSSPYAISIEPVLDGTKGRCFYLEQRIAVNAGMSELQTLKTAIHEVAHARLYEKNSHLTEDKQPDKATREVQAESVAYAVCQYWGLDTSDYSFGYIANWSSGRDLKELQASLETIRAAANDLINEMEVHLLELQQERQAQQEHAAPEQASDISEPRQEPQAWNGIDGLLNEKPLMPEASPVERAAALVALAEKDGPRLGDGERRLIMEYAEAVGDTDKVIELINRLCEQGFELQHGYMDDFMKSQMENEIAVARAEQTIARDPAAEPIVTIIWSESPHLKDGQQMPLHEAEAVFGALDSSKRLEREQPDYTGGWYDKTKFRIDFSFQGQPDNYEGRQDFGDGDGSLIEHIRGYHEYYAQDESWKNHVLKHEGPEAWEADKAQREMLLTEFVPYMELHCNLSRLEQEAQTRLASGETLTPEETAYYGALENYVKECRPLLNQGQYQLPEPPKLSDFDQSLQDYKAQVQAEIAQEVADAGMTVEEYAAAGYEAPTEPEPEPAPEQPQEAPEPPTKEPAASDYYYSINEGAARRAKEMNSYSDYKPGSATAEYRHYVDNAFEIAQAQKKRVDPMYHEKIDSLLDTYARKLAANMNHSFAIDARVPSILIAGGSNFPVRQKEKQNAARDSNMQEWQYIQGLLDKIRSTGMGGIRQDDPQAIPKLQKKLDGLVKAQETMKAVNAYYRKHGTLDGCPHLSPENLEKLKAAMVSGWHYEKKPFQSWELSNNNAEIRRIRQRIDSLTRARETVYVGLEFEGGHVEANREQSRLQVFFEDKPDADARQQLKEHGFRWAPSVGAWQRLLNGNAYYAADRISSIQPLTGEKPTELQRSSIRQQQAQMAQAQAEPEECVYRVHAATRSDSPENLYLLQAYVPQSDGTVKIGAVLYAGTEEKCRELLDQLNTGKLTQEAVKELYAKEQEQPQEATPEQETVPEPELEITPEPETAQDDVSDAEPQEKSADKPLTGLQKKAVEIAGRYKDLPLQGKIDIIAQAFGCKTGEIRTSPCTGKWRGTSDMSIHFDNGASLFIGNHLTPKAKTVKVQTECVNSALVHFNPEIVQAAKEAALPVLLQREAKDNEIAAQKGLKPYTLLNVEFNDGADEQTGGYIGWYYVTLAVDGKICTHLETGLSHDIADGKVSDTPTRADYFTAGALKETDVDYMFNNVGFSSASTLYALPLREDVRERAEKTLAERTAAEPQAGREWGFYVIADLKTWATNAEHQSPIEHFATFEEAKARFDELRGQPYNNEAQDLNDAGQPYAHLTLGVESKDGMSATDILQVRAGQNYLVDDFTRMERLRDDPVVLESLSRVAKEIGFDRVRPYVQENGSYKAMPDMPFSEWENPYFTVDPPEPDDTFSIYQVPAGPEGHDFRYRPYEELQAAGLTVDRKNYALVYTAPLDKKTTLEDIYRTFNADDRPAGFRGHSLSVSDVVVVNRGGKEEAHYCDSIGFTPVPEFMQESPIKTAEMSTEQNYNMIDGVLNNTPSMGELEARAKAGEQISLFDVAEAAKAEDKKPKQTRPASKTAQRQKKPSIRAQLKAAKEEQAKKPPQREKSKELEV